MADRPLKILVAGDVNGKFGPFFNRIETLNKKNGPFDMLFVAGSFFSMDPDGDDPSWFSYLSGDKQVPMTTYVLGPVRDHQLQHYANAVGGGELAENVHYLGPYGVFRTAENVTIAYLSGRFDERESVSNVADTSALRSYFTRADATNLCELNKGDGFKGVDVLLTSEWPSGITQLAAAPPARAGGGARDAAAAAAMGTPLVTQVDRALLPRYHFAAGEGVFYERPPYRNSPMHAPKPLHVTRFIALADFNNEAKHRAVYAFNLTPLPRMVHTALVAEPPGTTDNPFDVKTQPVASAKGPAAGLGSAPEGNFSYFFGQQGQKRRADGQRGPPPSTYTCNICNVPGHWIQDCPQAGEKRQRRERPPPAETNTECWFCLSSPQVEKHLVVSVGTEMYLALAKGPLVPEHILILPIMHVGSSVDLTDDAAEELRKYKGALRRYFRSKGQDCLFFERNIASRHMQIQVVPVPSELSPDALKEMFKEHGQLGGFALIDMESGVELKDTPYGKGGFFLVEFGDGSRCIYVKEEKEKARFPLQFAREVLGGVKALNCPTRIDWRACKQTMEEEKQAATDMRKAFKAFDIM